MTRSTRIREAIRKLRKKHVSVVFAPSGTASNRTFRVSLFRCYVAVAVSCICAVGLLVISLQYASRKELASHLDELQSRAEVREQKFSEIVRERARLQEELLAYSNFDDSLRIVHDLEAIPGDIREAGVGGPLTNITQMLKFGRDKNVDDLELALRQAQLQNDSFKEIITAQARTQHIFDHTPAVKPCAGPLCSGFCWRRNPIFGGLQFHKGVDIATVTGTPIISPADGIVRFAGMKGGYGYCVFVRHGYGFETRYGHCSQVLVYEGQHVKRGDIIAFVGATGWATGPHLHYEILVGGTHVDPEQYVLPDYLID
ncbi:MAG TPA: M23 family metallopeptidase [bacterium]|nr:M23 family metallopeptidase [bacterium]